MLLDQLDQLSPLGRGVLLAALMAGERGERGLAGLAGALPEACRAIWQELRAADRTARRDAIRRLTGELLGGIAPRRVDSVDPSWVGGADLSRLPHCCLQRLSLNLRAQLPLPITHDFPNPALIELSSWPLRRLHDALRQFALVVLAEVTRRAGPQAAHDLQQLYPLLGESDPARALAASDTVAPDVLEAAWPAIAQGWPMALGLARAAQAGPPSALLALGSGLAVYALEPKFRATLIIRLPMPLGRLIADCQMGEGGSAALLRAVLVSGQRGADRGGGWDIPPGVSKERR
jgi:hypothetical protein